MATQQLLIKDGVAGLLFSNGTDYDATDLGDIENTDTAPTAVQIDLTSVAANEARASTKADFGETRALEYAVTMSLEFATAPVTGQTVDLYWSPSHSATAGKGNMGWVSGTDGDYTGTPATLDDLRRRGTRCCGCYRDSYLPWEEGLPPVSANWQGAQALGAPSQGGRGLGKDNGL